MTIMRGGAVRDWLGDFEIGDRWARWTGSAGDSLVHRHLSAQAVLSDAPVTAIDKAGRAVVARVILIEPLAAHRIEPGTRASFLFVEPPFRSPEAEAFLSPWFAAHPPVILAERPGPGYWGDWLRLAGGREGPADPRIVAAVASIDRRLDAGALRLEDFAAEADISPGRFRHLFAQEMQTPFRRFVLWRRLIRAVAHLRAGRAVTAAAHEAGFADAAHFARVLKAAFGIRATQALVTRARD